MTRIDQAAVAADLRTLADLVERDEFAAGVIRYLIHHASVWPVHSLDYRDPRRVTSEGHKAVMADAVRAFKAAGASIEKQYSDKYFSAFVTLPGGLKIELTDERDKVCSRVVTGTREVIEEVADPEALAAVPKITQTRIEEIVEWRCEPLLAAGGDAA